MRSSSSKTPELIQEYEAAFGQTVSRGIFKLARGIPGAGEKVDRDLQDSVRDKSPIQDWHASVELLHVPSADHLKALEDQ